MSTGKLIYSSQAWIEGGAAAWTTLSGTTEEFCTAIDNTSTGYDQLDFFPEVDFDATPTDYVLFSLYGSPDGTNYDDTPFFQMKIDKAIDPNQVLVQIPRPPAYVKASFQQDGSTDSHNVRCSWIGQRWSNA